MIVGMAEKVPRLLPGVDIRKFKLDPMDGFLLTRINGKLDPRALSLETGLPDFSVARALEKLEKLGVIEIVDPNAPPPAPPPPPPGERKSTVAKFEDGLLGARYDPAELLEDADLTAEQKKRVLDFYYRLDDLDHYTLLGIGQETDKKGIKRAYFELAAIFHPDRYFKKNLGSFKPKMEALFNRITEAHDTLVDAEKRAEYDAYIAEVATTRGMEAMLERAMAESAAAAAAQQAQQSIPPPPPSGGRISVPSAHDSGPSESEMRSRREALARRLRGGGPPPPNRVSKPPEPQPSHLKFGSTQDAMDALKRRYEDRIEHATQQHAMRYVASAEEALAKNDLVAAATSLSIATKFAPDDAALAMRAQEVKNMADKTLSESYLKQAQYEERQGHWFEAARSWQKVAKIKNDAISHERAANAIWRAADGDLREGAEHAKRAITLAPDVIENHMTLVEVYIKAGLNSSARRACEAAVQLDPKHVGLQTILKRIPK